jgi:hypothetical protein
MPDTYAAFSGGKDSTAMVLRMAELGEAFSCLFTPLVADRPSRFSGITASGPELRSWASCQPRGARVIPSTATSKASSRVSHSALASDEVK